jgi:hypothetical protein
MMASTAPRGATIGLFFMVLAATSGRTSPVFAEPAAAAEPVYCSGCLCDDERPDMPLPGAWQPTGAMIAGRPILKFVPRHAEASAGSACRARFSPEPDAPASPPSAGATG